MSYSVTVQPGGLSFAAEPDETLLSAALRQNVALPYGCQQGACGACKCKVTFGQVEPGEALESALSPEETTQGWALACRARARSHMVLECEQAAASCLHRPRKLPVRVAEMERLAPDVMRVRLQLPAHQAMPYHAGQFMDVTLPGGLRRSYSMANAPAQGEAAEAARLRGQAFVDLHIRHMPSGALTDRLFSGQVKLRDIWRAESPKGSFYLREGSDKPVILLASGTGFAPLKAILEHMQQSGSRRPVTLYWGGRRPQDIYLADWVSRQLERMPALRFVPVVSDPAPQDGWTGRSGWVHQAVLQDWPDLSGHQVYACGAPQMVQAARRDFCALAGLPESEFFADAFTSAADLAPAAARQAETAEAAQAAEAV